MPLSIVKTWIGLHTQTSRIALLLILILMIAAPCFASGGACPAGVPVTGNNCYFVAANGADTNNGTTESTPWLHAPGMPSCSGNCQTVQTSWGNDGNTPKNLGGLGLIFRGGDTWHFGNPAASPYTGGTWDVYWSGNSTNCTYEGSIAGCFYIGVDTGWYNSSVCTSGWCRPKFNGDNPLSTSLVSSCAYYPIGSNNVMITLKNLNSWLYMDSLELLGLCSNDTSGHVGSANYNALIFDAGTLMNGAPGMDFEVNFYVHGWTVTTATSSNGAIACNALGGGALQSKIRVVVDGSDSSGFSTGVGTCATGIFTSNYHLVDSIFRYSNQMVGAWCHDTHDNIFEYQVPSYVPTHNNVYECNNDAVSTAPGQATLQANVVYNNIFRHDLGNVGPDLWLCPGPIPEYWFNNLMYDLGGQGWSIAGPAGYGASCNNAGGQYMFNNTLVDMTQPCSLNAVNNGTNGQYLTVLNEHLINTPLDTFISPGCTGRTSATNVAMTDSAATSQGYTTGSAGKVRANNCANDTTTPCVPTSASNATVGKGASQTAYCTTLASYTSESAVATDAANACRYGTTDGCSYNVNNHTMVCPAQTVVGRPAQWDAGAYQFGQSQPPPKDLVATVK